MDRECNWFIIVIEGKIVLLMFEFFEVDFVIFVLLYLRDCRDDYVEVFDGISEKDYFFGRFCIINNKFVGMLYFSGR